MKATAGKWVLNADGSPAACSCGAYLDSYQAAVSLNGEPCEDCCSADEEAGEVVVYVRDEELMSITAYQLLHDPGNYQFLGEKFPPTVLKVVQGTVRLSLTCITCGEVRR